MYDYNSLRPDVHWSIVITSREVNSLCQTAVQNLDMKNGIAAHVKHTGHMIKWDEVK